MCHLGPEIWVASSALHPLILFSYVLISVVCSEKQAERALEAGSHCVHVCGFTPFSLYSLSLSCECVSVCVRAFGLPSILAYLGNALFDGLHKRVWRWYMDIFALCFVLEPGLKELCKLANVVNTHKITAEHSMHRAVACLFCHCGLDTGFSARLHWSTGFTSASWTSMDTSWFIQQGFRESAVRSEISNPVDFRKPSVPVPDLKAFYTVWIFFIYLLFLLFFQEVQ